MSTKAALDLVSLVIRDHLNDFTLHVAKRKPLKEPAVTLLS